MALNKTVALVGMMGAGKTSIGQRLAARLDVPFADADHEIEAAAGMTVAEIFAKYRRARIPRRRSAASSPACWARRRMCWRPAAAPSWTKRRAPR